MINDAFALPSVSEKSGTSSHPEESAPCSRGSFSIAKEGTFLASKPSGTNLAIPFPTITLRATFTFLVEALIDKDNVTSKLIATVLMQFCFMIS